MITTIIIEFVQIVTFPFHEISKEFSVIFEALEDLTQPVEDFVDETREDIKEELKEFDENMSEREW